MKAQNSPTNADELKSTNAVQWIISKSGPMLSWDDDNNESPIPGSSFFKGTLPRRMVEQIKADFEAAGGEHYDNGKTATWALASGETEQDYSMAITYQISKKSRLQCRYGS